MKPFYLYKIVNSVNDKVYIGITSRLRERKNEHFSKSSKCSKLKRAMDKYGRENFSLEVLCVGSEEYILDLEFKAIDLYNSIDNGYNILYGHPNQLGVSMPEESRRKASESLKRFHKENPNYLKENRKPRKLKEPEPHYISGFWFPSPKVGMEALKMNEKSFYKRKSAGTLGDVCHPQSKSISHSPIYVLGFWFPDTFFAIGSLNKTKGFIQHLLRKKDFEEELKIVGTKPRLKPENAPIGVNVRENGKFRAKMVHNGETVFDKTFENLDEAIRVYDNYHEDIRGTRPNNTIR